MFCKQCVIELLYANREAPCPRCKCVPFKTQEEIHKVVQGVLHKTMVKWDANNTFRLDELGTHISLKHLPCPLDCDRDRTYTAEELAHHMTEACPFRITSCNSCSEIYLSGFRP